MVVVWMVGLWWWDFFIIIVVAEVLGGFDMEFFFGTMSL